MTAALRLVAYCRVSTEDQAREGVSLADQQERLAAYAVSRGFALVGTFTDAGISAKDLNRPALRQALAMLAAGKADGLVVTKLDRLIRSVKWLGELVEGPFRAGRHHLFSVSESIDTSTAGGRMVLNLLSTVSQWEREVISERTRAGLAHIKRHSGRTGSVPFGQRLVDGWQFLAEGDPARKRLYPHDAEQSVVRLVHQLHAAGIASRAAGASRRHAKGSLRAIAAILDERGIRTRNGKPWLSTQISRILATPPLPELEPLAMAA